MHHALRRLDLNLLLVFDTLYRWRQVSVAADALSLSPSAFSQALSRLRAALGDELFVRVGQGMQPTPYAQHMAVDVQAALQMLNGALQGAGGFDPQTSTRSFVLAATDYTACVLLPPLMAKLALEAPKVHVRVVSSEQHVPVAALASGQLDFAVGFTGDVPELPGQILRHRWFEDDYVVLLRQDHPLLSGAWGLDAYLAAQHVVVTPWNEQQGVVDRALAAGGWQRQVKLHLPSVLAAPFVIAQTDLLMSIPRRAAQILGKALPVAQRPMPLPLPAFSVCLYQHVCYQTAAAPRWLLQQLTTTLDAAPA